MKLKVNVKALKEGLDVVSKAVDNKRLLHILGGILLDASKPYIRLASTNLEVSIETIVSADIKEHGAIVVPGKVFYDFVKKFPGEEMTLSADLVKNKVKITGEKSLKLDISALAAESFPDMPVGFEETSFGIEGQTLKTMIDKTLYCVDPNVLQTPLKGCLFEASGKTLTLIGTDGFRIAQTQRLIEIKGKFRQILPFDSCYELGKLIPNSEEEVRVEFGKNQVMFTFGNTKFVTKLIAGDYPDIASFWPRDSHTEVKSDAKALLNALDRVNLIVNQLSAKKMEMDLSDNELIVSGVSNSLGSHQEKVAVESKKSEGDISVSFNLDFIKDALKWSKVSEVNLGFSEMYNLLVITSEEDEKHKALIMPLTGE